MIDTYKFSTFSLQELNVFCSAHLYSVFCLQCAHGKWRVLSGRSVKFSVTSLIMLHMNITFTIDLQAYFSVSLCKQNASHGRAPTTNCQERQQSSHGMILTTSLNTIRDLHIHCHLLWWCSKTRISAFTPATTSSVVTYHRSYKYGLFLFYFMLLGLCFLYLAFHLSLFRMNKCKLLTKSTVKFDPLGRPESEEKLYCNLRNADK